MTIRILHPIVTSFGILKPILCSWLTRRFRTVWVIGIFWWFRMNQTVQPIASGIGSCLTGVDCRGHRITKRLPTPLRSDASRDDYRSSDDYNIINNYCFPGRIGPSQRSVVGVAVGVRSAYQPDGVGCQVAPRPRIIVSIPVVKEPRLPIESGILLCFICATLASRSCATRASTPRSTLRTAETKN